MIASVQIGGSYFHREKDEETLLMSDFGHSGKPSAENVESCGPGP
jgi:hypothetical protein